MKNSENLINTIVYNYGGAINLDNLIAYCKCHVDISEPMREVEAIIEKMDNLKIIDYYGLGNGSSKVLKKMVYNISLE